VAKLFLRCLDGRQVPIIQPEVVFRVSLLGVDLDLPGRRPIVRQGKDRKDRTVYLTNTAVWALQGYLAVRRSMGCPGPSCAAVVE
jgi:site-specific recombinase XerD